MRRSDKVFRIELEHTRRAIHVSVQRLTALTVGSPSVSSKSDVVLKLINVRRIDLNSNEVDHSLLSRCISLNVALGRAECLMAG